MVVIVRVRYEGLTPEELAHRLDTRSCLVLECVKSTQDLLHELAEEGAPAGSVVLADEQVQGRGRHRRSWVSPRGSGILLSYLIRPQDPESVAVASLRVGLAVLSALDAMGVDARLKWPNDVMIAERKAAGVLCEARWRNQDLLWIVAGIGINVFGPVPAEVQDRALALDEIVPDIDRLTVLEQLVARLHIMPDDEVLTDEESKTLRAHDWLAHRPISQPLVGTARGIARNGALMVETPDGPRTIFGGEVVIA